MNNFRGEKPQMNDGWRENLLPTLPNLIIYATYTGRSCAVGKKFAKLQPFQIVEIVENVDFLK